MFNLGLASLQHVFDSLTENGKGVLKLIVKEQINQIAKQKDGPNFKGFTVFKGSREINFSVELYKLCRKAFLVNSEVGLKAQLVELKDHRLIPESNDQIRIQLAPSQLESFLHQNAWKFASWHTHMFIITLPQSLLPIRVNVSNVVQGMSDSDGEPKVEAVPDKAMAEALARQLQQNPEKVKSLINSIDIEGI